MSIAAAGLSTCSRRHKFDSQGVFGRRRETSYLCVYMRTGLAAAQACRVEQIGKIATTRSNTVKALRRLCRRK
ncbi:hypothetical protein Mal52_43470 [Symmachiella dynata]|uniref:Uncharacterized protein n=1 Tax=Symmachiella dynata TaxID=2527995 RepID=A0A517ZTN6_9PLAN|nr:hypothetical protein Mal52_43470 [Symmachiella dynata]